MFPPLAPWPWILRWDKQPHGHHDHHTDILHLGYNGVGVRAGLGHLGLGLDQLKVLPPLIVRSPFLTLQLH